MTFDEQVKALRNTVTPKRKPKGKRKADCTPEEWAANLEYHRLLRASFTDAQKARQKENCTRWRIRNVEKFREYARRHRAKNPHACRARHKAWMQRNPSYWRDYARRKRAECVQTRLRHALRSRLYKAVSRALGGRAVKADTTMALVGCTPAELMRHLESQFQPGMGWHNWGRGEGKWHIDHVVPLSRMNLESAVHQRMAFAYKNLRPMWGEANMSKSNTVKWADVYAHIKGGKK